MRQIEEKMNVKLGDEEAGNVAMHLINAQINEDGDQTIDARTIAKRFVILLRLFVYRIS